MIGIYTVLVVLAVLLSYAGVFHLGRRFEREILTDAFNKVIRAKDLTRSRLG